MSILYRHDHVPVSRGKMGFKDLIKPILLKTLPDPILQYVRKIHYSSQLASISENDEPDLRVIKHVVKPGDCVLDIGANIGVYTLFLSRWVGHSGSVYSIEPIPLAFEVLKHNVKEFKLENVRTFNCGISERDGSAVMEIPTYATGGENLYQARVLEGPVVDQTRRHFRVPLRTLDSFLNEQLRHIDFMKIDVEGHELQVISGGKKLIQRWKPSLLIEISGDPDDSNSSAFKVLRVLQGQGYKAFWYDGIQLKPRQHGDKSVNYFFLTDQHLHQFNSQAPVESKR